MDLVFIQVLGSGIQRAEHLLAANDALVKTLRQHDDDLLAVPVPPSEAAQPVKRTFFLPCGLLSDR